jgi:hypothetical protein
MADERLYDSKTWVEETGASTGDARENDPRSPGFAGGEDRVFRSRLQHVNRLADRSPGPDEAETIEKDHESGWLNVRVGSGEWAAVPVVRDADIADSARQGRVSNMPPAGTSPSHDRVTFSDPVAGGVDPTSPWSPDSQP